MRCVQSIQELKANMAVLDRYLDRKQEITYSFALERIKKGTCFVAARTETGYRFYPSRFIGYAGNTMDKHLNNTEKDGTVTNPVISRLLGHKAVCNPVLEKAYREYCESLGFIPNDRGAFGVERKFWEFI